MTISPRLLGNALVVSALSMGCAAYQNPAAGRITPTSLPQKVVFDVDLTKGNAGTGEVSGGEWDHGWKVSKEKGDRIVFDAGRPIQQGYLEVSFTMIRKPNAGTPRKIDWVGVFEDAAINQAESSGDIFYARAGDPKYRFSRIKAGGKKFDDTEWEKSIGDEADWKTDGKTVQTVKLEWRDGMAIFWDIKKKPHACEKEICDTKFPIDKLRYCVIGSDRYTELGLVGQRFVHAKLVEYVPADKAAP